MSRAIDGGLHSTANALRAGPRPTRQSRKKLIDARRQSGNPVMAFSDNQERHRKALRSFELKMIIARYRPPPQTLIAAAVLIQIVARQTWLEFPAPVVCSHMTAHFSTPYA